MLWFSPQCSHHHFLLNFFCTVISTNCGNNVQNATHTKRVNMNEDEIQITLNGEQTKCVEILFSISEIHELFTIMR